MVKIIVKSSLSKQMIMYNDLTVLEMNIINFKTVLKNISNSELEEKVLTLPTVEKFLNGFTPKKVIIVTGKIINVVI